MNTPTRLYDKYRPTTLDDVLGQPKAVAIARRLVSDGLGGRAVWISGASGTGKTTLARILAASIADKWGTVEFDSAVGFGVAELDELRSAMGYRSLCGSGRAWIVNGAPQNDRGGAAQGERPRLHPLTTSPTPSLPARAWDSPAKAPAPL